MKSGWNTLAASMVALTLTAQAEVSHTTLNNGNLVMQDIPPIPESVVADLSRYQNVRSAGFLDWTREGSGVYVSTRFGNVSQVHRVDFPGGARRQLTFFDEPVGGLSRQPGGDRLIFTMDAGGSEFAQLFLLDPTGNEDAIMLTDGESRNGAVNWDRKGERITYLSTRRNGASNDIWMMRVDNPETAEIVFESPDGTYWYGADFSADGGQLLVGNYVGNADSRIYLLDLETREMRLLAGDPEDPSSNSPWGFDHDGEGFWFVTDVGGDFRQLAWQSLEPGSKPEIVTSDIAWHVEGGSVNDERTRAAFTVNEDGFSRLYLMDPGTRAFKPVTGMPTGLVGGLEFSPDGKRLGLTLNTPTTPSDAFVLELGADALAHGEMVRWTYSEVGGLDTDTFVEPELVRFPTFDSGSGGPETIPAWC